MQQIDMVTLNIIPAAMTPITFKIKKLQHLKESPIHPNLMTI